MSIYVFLAKLLLLLLECATLRGWQQQKQTKISPSSLETSGSDVVPMPGLEQRRWFYLKVEEEHVEQRSEKQQQQLTNNSNIKSPRQKDGVDERQC